MRHTNNFTIESRIQGIPCLIEILSFFKCAPCRWADNPDEYYGYTDVEYTVLDRKGYTADWLARKMSKEDQWKIEAEIEEFYESLGEE